uniref:hypothetical protein n=1 Tax=Pandoraea sputorum TaxID=93222 RepID=UPI003558BCE6
MTGNVSIPNIPYPLQPLLLAMTLGVPALASAAEEDRLPTVTVTAEHREENLQKTPVAISAF